DGRTNSADILVGPAEAHWITLEVRIPFESSQQVGSGVHEIHFNVERLASGTDGTPATVSEKSTFLVPR
ncbi:MAG: cytochrome c oxidase accessory protein CcoG, partial [Betaproteobacteria bacterium]|nr:cytochrome c oxidase accessory protein CcoG [Betaproteobacteria bacterium]